MHLKQLIWNTKFVVFHPNQIEHFNGRQTSVSLEIWCTAVPVIPCQIQVQEHNRDNVEAVLFMKTKNDNDENNAAKENSAKIESLAFVQITKLRLSL